MLSVRKVKKRNPVLTKDEVSEGENLQDLPAADNIGIVSNEGESLGQDTDKPESVAIKIPAC